MQTKTIERKKNPEFEVHWKFSNPANGICLEHMYKRQTLKYNRTLETLLLVTILWSSCQTGEL